MDNLNLDCLRGVVTSGPTPLFATVSGAHLYGFPSPDSDVDLRGAFVLPVREVIRLREPVETLTVTRTVGGVEVDWVAHDVRKFARLMTRRNGYDTKHAMHLLRLLRMGEEILREGAVRVLRPDAEWLLLVRSGGLTYEQVLTYAAEHQVRLAATIARSPLPEEPDEPAADRLLIELQAEYLFGGDEPSVHEN